MTPFFKLHLAHIRFYIIVVIATIPFASCKKKDEHGFREQSIPVQFLDIGPGRNDGINRAYGIRLKNPFDLSGIREYTYEDGKWERTGTVTDESAGWAWLDDLKSDGKQHLIALGHQYFEKTYNIEHQYFTELTYEEEEWKRDTLYTSGLEVHVGGFASGNFSNQDTKSLIVQELDIGEERLIEVFFTGMEWNTRLIEILDSDDPIVGMTAGNVRGLDRDHVYLSSRSGRLFELAYDGEWRKTEMPQIFPGEPEVSYAYSFLLQPIGETGSLYVMGVENFYEYYFENGSWSRSVISSDIGGLFEIEYGDVRNDGVNRLYMPAIFGTIYEITPGSENAEVNKYRLSGSDAIQNILIADGRNDGVNRVYIVQGWTDNLELTYR